MADPGPHTGTYGNANGVPFPHMGTHRNPNINPDAYPHTRSRRGHPPGEQPDRGSLYR